MAKENKFTRSVLQRLELEQEQEKKEHEEQKEKKEKRQKQEKISNTPQTAEPVRQGAEESKTTTSTQTASPSESEKEATEPSGTGAKTQPQTGKNTASAPSATKQAVQVESSEKTVLTATQVATDKQEEPVAMPDLSAILGQTPQRVAKNKTFYLDEEVIDGVRKAAKAQKMTDSRLVNEILRSVLGIS